MGTTHCEKNWSWSRRCQSKSEDFWSKFEFLYQFFEQFHCSGIKRLKLVLDYNRFIRTNLSSSGLTMNFYSRFQNNFRCIIQRLWDSLFQYFPLQNLYTLTLNISIDISCLQIQRQLPFILFYCYFALHFYLLLYSLQ